MTAFKAIFAGAFAFLFTVHLAQADTVQFGPVSDDQWKMVLGLSKNASDFDRGQTSIAKIDLGGADHPTYFLRLENSYWCGSGGCSLEVVQEVDGKFVVIGDFQGKDVEVLSTTHDGMHDFQIADGATAKWDREVSQYLDARDPKAKELALATMKKSSADSAEPTTFEDLRKKLGFKSFEFDALFNPTQNFDTNKFAWIVANVDQVNAGEVILKSRYQSSLGYVDVLISPQTKQFYGTTYRIGSTLFVIAHQVGVLPYTTVSGQNRFMGVWEAKYVGSLETKDLAPLDEKLAISPSIIVCSDELSAKIMTYYEAYQEVRPEDKPHIAPFGIYQQSPLPAILSVNPFPTIETLLQNLPSCRKMTFNEVANLVVDAARNSEYLDQKTPYVGAYAYVDASFYRLITTDKTYLYASRSFTPYVPHMAVVVERRRQQGQPQP